MSRVFTNCNVCGNRLRTEAEDQMGMCDQCAGECGEEEISREVDRLSAENRALRAALQTMRDAAEEACDSAGDPLKPWSILAAMSGNSPGVDPEITAALALIEPAEQK